MKKICTQCGLEKDLEDYHKVYSKKKNGDVMGDGRRANCAKCENARRKKQYDSNPITRMMMNSKARAKQGKIEFNISVEDVPIPEFCPILEVRLEMGTKDNYPFAPSIDRIDSTKGYIKGNVKVISMLANRMKSNATKEQCFKFAKNVENFFN